jgi:N-acetyltransferase
MKRRSDTQDHLKLPVAPMVMQPVTLEGQVVRLEPLSMAHLDQLCEVAFDEDIWRWMLSTARNPDDLRAYIESALKFQAEGAGLPFATIDKTSGRAIGSTRYQPISLQNHCVEIGHTWIGKAWQRTAVNTEAKYLMLRHAFEVLDCIRVELKTDFHNDRSRAAIARLGAKQEGIFRNHLITPTGRIRDSVWFSITDTEWPTVKKGLEEKLARKY